MSTNKSVSGYKHDVFVSYAQVDNDPLTDKDVGWVTTFIKTLSVRLNQLCGRRDAYSLWWDHSLAKNVNITPEIFATLENCAVLLVILSPGYLKSDWCKRERTKFLNEITNRVDAGASVFVVHRDKIDQAECPPEFADKLGYRFWEEHDGQPRILGYPAPTLEDKEYYNRIDDLARAAVATLEKTAASRVGRPEQRLSLLGNTPDATSFALNVNAASEQSDRPLIFLAETTDGLDPLRSGVIRFLDQFGYGVLPKKWYSRESAAGFQEALDQDLSRCLLFAQLLDGSAGKTFPGSTTDAFRSYITLQYQRASELGLPILQWRDRALQIDTQMLDVYRTMLHADTVKAVDIEAFKGLLVELADQEEARLNAPREEKRSSSCRVFVNNEPKDREFAETICEALTEHGCMTVLPIQEGKPQEIRDDRERNLVECDGLIVLYGDVPSTWVRQQLLDWQKVLYKREKPLRALAVVYGPPDAKQDFRVRMPKLQEINCKSGVQSDSLRSFVQLLESV